MYAILVNEPGGVTPSYILGTGASSLEAAQLLMSSRAEEFVSEQLELGVDGAEDYSIVSRENGTVQVVIERGTELDDIVLITFEATAIDEVV